MTLHNANSRVAFTSTIALSVLSLLLESCSGADNEPSPEVPADAEVPRDAEVPADAGDTHADGPSYWELESDGWVLAVANGEYALLEPTPVSCLISWRPGFNLLSGPVDNFLRIYGMPEGATLKRGADFEATNTFTGDPARFTALSEAPVGCESGLTGDFSSPDYQHDAERDFEILWHWFAQLYPFWEMYGVDRDEQYATFRSKVDSRTSAAELASVLQDALAPLDDGHILLYAWEGGWQGIDDPTLIWSPEKPKVHEERLLQQFEAQDEIEDPELFVAAADEAAIGIIVEKYLEEPPNSSANGTIMWGKLGTANVGYIAINEMAAILENASLAEELAEVDRILDTAIADLGSVDGMVVDVRRNGGGFDLIARRIASHFAVEREVAYSKKTYRDGVPGEEQIVYLEPSTGTQFEGPVAVLTSDITMSAAETFVMAMDSLPQVTLIGEATNGALSNTVYRRVSAELVMSLSAELYYDAKGVLREGVGMEPDVVAPMLSQDDRNEGKDSAIDLAIERLTTN